MMDILVGIAIFAGSLILLVTAFIVLRWSFKWVRRIFSFFVFVLAILFLLEIVTSFICYPLFNKYIGIIAFKGFDVVVAIISVLVLGFLFISLPGALPGIEVIKQINIKLSYLSENEKDLLKRLKAKDKDSIDNQVIAGKAIAYARGRASLKGILFSLYSLIILIIFIFVQALILSWFSYLFSINPYGYLKYPILYKLSALIPFLCIGARTFQLVNKDSDSMKTYGIFIVSVNTIAMCLLTFFLYDSYVRLFLSHKKFSFFIIELISLDIKSLPIITATFVTVVYFSCINLSAFLMYGFDGGIAWLLENSKKDEEDQKKKYRKGSMTIQGEHWSQRLVRKFVNDEKRKNLQGELRMPEQIFHWHNACGGTIGAYAGHWFFNHKKMFSFSSSDEYLIKKILENEKKKVPSDVKFAPVFETIVFCQIVLLIALTILEQVL